MDPAIFAKKRTIALTTRGRVSGRPRTVKIWFVVAGPKSIFVQHASSAPSQWFRNLKAEPAVQVDFGGGTVAGRATPLTDPEQIREVLRLVRRKYPLAWLIQLLGRKAKPLAAEIVLEG